MLEMADPRADSRIVADVLPAAEGAEWRFTGAHPRFRLQVKTRGNLTFYMRFILPDEMRRPIVLRVHINANEFQSYRMRDPGEVEYRRPIPDNWVPSVGPVEIGVDVDPPWRSPDGTLLGVLLNSIGFEKRER